MVIHIRFMSTLLNVIILILTFFKRKILLVIAFMLLPKRECFEILKLFSIVQTKLQFVI